MLLSYQQDAAQHYHSQNPTEFRYYECVQKQQDILSCKEIPTLASAAANTRTVAVHNIYPRAMDAYLIRKVVTPTVEIEKTK